MCRLHAARTLLWNHVWYWGVFASQGLCDDCRGARPMGDSASRPLHLCWSWPWGLAQVSWAVTPELWHSKLFASHKVMTRTVTTTSTDKVFIAWDLGASLTCSLRAVARSRFHGHSHCKEQKRRWIPWFMPIAWQGVKGGRAIGGLISSVPQSRQLYFPHVWRRKETEAFCPESQILLAFLLLCCIHFASPYLFLCCCRRCVCSFLTSLALSPNTWNLVEKSRIYFFDLKH